jgi:hypothetical protein
MARCPSCEYPLPADRERLGARCPRCRDPIYEPGGRFPRVAAPGEATCAAHPASESVGVCNRCGAYVCEACRTMWRGQVVCVACLDKAFASGEATPEAARMHRRQGLLALGFGLGAWLLSGLAAGGLYLTGAALTNPSASEGQVGLLVAVLALFVAAGFVALFGVGHSSAALRSRGGPMALAGVGLVLSGLYLGILIGLSAFSVWQFLGGV